MFGDNGNDLLDVSKISFFRISGIPERYWSGERYQNRLYGGFGNDTLVGSYGGRSNVRRCRRRPAGGPGRRRSARWRQEDDWLSAGNGADRLSGGDAADWLDGGRNGDAIDGGAGRDTLLRGAGDDRLAGGDDEDRLEGGSGDDLIEAGAAATL